MTININFNLPFNEAIAQMASRGVVLPELYYGQLQGIHRQLAFSIAGIAKVDQLQAVLDSLTNHLKNGGTFASWQKNIDVKALGLPKHRLDNIFRTNIQQAYNHGHWQHALANQDTHGYLMYDAINDSRTRPSHRLNDGIIRKIHDPIWKRIWFSRNVYRCRCRLLSLTEDQAIARSGEGQGIHKTATEDPLRDKAWDKVDVMNADVLSVGVEQAVIKRLADSQNPALKQAFVKATEVINAQQLALNYGVKDVNYAGRLDIANEVNIVLSEFKQRGLPIPDNVLVNEKKFIEWAALDDSNPKNIVASFVSNISQTQSYLLLNPLYPHWDNLKLDASDYFKSKFWSTNSKSHAIYHEFGHFMHYTQDSALYLKLRGAEFTAEEALIAQQVSLYAATKPIEFIAEVFAKLSVGASVSNKVMGLYKQLSGYEL
ncbi:MAG: phage minor head protein [Methylococcales bacterium]